MYRERRISCIWFAAVLGAIAVGLWSGCSVSNNNYELLSFFLDGVPDPNAPEGTVLADGSIATVSSHEPFAEKRCTECHPTLFEPVLTGSEVCLDCHAEALNKQVRMHGPVAAGDCLFCHNPHSSKFSFLLRDAPQHLCIKCHDQVTGVVKAHADDTRNCLDCHGGHGGSNAYFLLESAIEELTPPEDTNNKVEPDG